MRVTAPAIACTAMEIGASVHESSESELSGSERTRLRVPCGDADDEDTGNLTASGESGVRPRLLRCSPPAAGVRGAESRDHGARK